MSRAFFVVAVLTNTAAVAGISERFDFTCTDSGVRVRIAMDHEIAGQLVPCNVRKVTHPLGRYHVDWQLLLRAEDIGATCSVKVIEEVKTLRDDGWKCRRTKDWRQRPE